MESTKLGSKLKFFRNRSGKSQFDVEVELDMSPGNLSRIENGHINPTKETVYRIAEVYGLNQSELSYLLGIFDKKPTKVELTQVRDATNNFFDRKDVFAYMLDERWNLVAVSKGFSELLGVPHLFIKGVIGKNLLKIVFNPASPVHSKINWDDKGKMAALQLSRLKNDFGYLSDETWFKELLSDLLMFEQFKLGWEQLDKLGIDYFSDESRTVTFKLKGQAVDFIYSREVLKEFPRFTIIQYRKK